MCSVSVARDSINIFRIKDRPWKYQALAEVMKEICSGDECNDTYGWIWMMCQALLLKQRKGSISLANGLCTESWIRLVSVRFNLSRTMWKGHDFKDFICPDTFEFEKD